MIFVHVVIFLQKYQVKRLYLILDEGSSPKRAGKGYLSSYQKLVQRTDKGAVLGSKHPCRQFLRDYRVVIVIEQGIAGRIYSKTGIDQNRRTGLGTL